MSATIQLKFGTLELSNTNNITIDRISEKAAKPIKTTPIPATDGATVEITKIGPKTITISGDIAGTSYDDLRTNIDALHAGLLNGLQKLTKDNERYIYCQLRDFSYSYDHLTIRATWTANFVAHFPFWLAETATTDSRAPTSGVGYAITNNGNAPTRVKVEITANAEIADALKMENTTKGQTFQFRGTVAAAKVLEVDNRYDTDDFEVLNDSVNAHVDYEGDFLELNAGSNTMKYTGTVPTSVLLTWRDCWY
uniref:Putative tail protein n=1 Tax=viral metagenome TaxID=1070528 RepID=A0A6H1ZEP2_9ZZZZ